MAEEAHREYQNYLGLLESASQKEGYATVNWIISGVALPLSITLMLISRRKRSLESPAASYRTI